MPGYRKQRRDFGPGEDHNNTAANLSHAVFKQRRDFGPGEDHNGISCMPSMPWTPAAPGLRPRRGSQPRHGRLSPSPPGEQRRDFGPGEDHNLGTSLTAICVTVGSAGASAPARITTVRADLGTIGRVAAPGLRPRRGSQQLVSGPPSLRREQRRGFGPGEDHNILADLSRPGDRGGSAGASAPARITTPRVSAPQYCAGAAPGLRPRRGSQQPRRALRTLYDAAAPGLRPRRGSQQVPQQQPAQARRGSAGTSAPARITTSSAVTG